MTAEIIELPKGTVADIPRVLRAIADQIEAGEYGAVIAAALVVEAEGGGIRTFGGGAFGLVNQMAKLHC